jgi:hypothetical protein
MPAYLLCEKDGLEPSRIVIDHPGNTNSVESYVLHHKIGGEGRVFSIHPLPLDRNRMGPDKSKETFLLACGSKEIVAPTVPDQKSEGDDETKELSDLSGLDAEADEFIDEGIGDMGY